MCSPPDLWNPLDGMHRTVKLDVHTMIGPTAFPCFRRKHYKKFQNYRAGKFLVALGREAKLFIRNISDYRKLSRDKVQNAYHSRITAIPRGVDQESSA